MVEYGPKIYILDSDVSDLKYVASCLTQQAQVEVVIEEFFPERIKYSFIYLLWDDDEIVYVGKTIQDIETRIRSHINKKAFDSYSYMEVNPTILSDLEMYLITSLKPKYNKACVYTELVTRVVT